MNNLNGSVLYVAYHYPPILGSSGVHRTLAFTRHLQQQGWQVRVLTTSIKAYANWSEDQFSFIPDNVEVIRAYARDVSRHYAINNKYLGAMAIPDNWQSWIIGGVLSGLKSIWANKPSVIISTYPIASAHIIGYLLHKITKVPWVADLRDPMAQATYPSDPKKKKVFEWIERKIVKHCHRAIVTAPGAKDFYIDKFPDVEHDFWAVIPNGFDATIFDELTAQGRDTPSSAKKVLLHSGLIYPSERDPSQFFSALSELKREGKISADSLEVRLRASGHDDLFSRQVKQFDVDDIVKFESTVPYKVALEEMFTVDGLLLLQAANCNYQIPAKAYEYIRTQKPVLALTPPEGDTGKLLLDAGNTSLARLDDKEQIRSALLDFLPRMAQNGENAGDLQQVERYSRQYQAKEFEKILLQLV